MSRRTLFLLALLPALASANSQTPYPLPYTVTTIGGGASSTPGTGVACATGSPLTSTDALGDGCLATQVQIATSGGYDGLAVDPAGNVFTADYSGNEYVVRVINAQNGVISLVAGGGAVCAAKTDTLGDGCPAATGTVLNNFRGAATDPWGNVLIAGYSSQSVNVVCRAVSPLCPNTTGANQLGDMYLVAGCVSGSGAISGGTNVASGLPAAPTGVSNCAAAGYTELDQPRGVAADRYGNVYIADTANDLYRVVLGPASFDGVSNPLYAVINAYATYAAGNSGKGATAGYIYTLIGGFTSPSSGTACTGVSTATALDAHGDGCPFYNTSMTPSSSDTDAITVDPAGDIVIFDKSDSLLRVIYMGGSAMGDAITTYYANLSTPASVTPQVGYAYVIAGGGSSTAWTSSPASGSTASLSVGGYRISSDDRGNIYIGNSNNGGVVFLDIATDYLRQLTLTGDTPALGGSSVLSLGSDPQGNLYLYDTANNLIRKVIANSFAQAGMAMGSSETQAIYLHAPAGTTAITASLLNNTGNALKLGTPGCGAANADGTLDCTLSATFAPTAPGIQNASLAVTPTGSSAVVLPVPGEATGAALVADGASTTQSSIGSSLTLAGLADDGQGNFYTSNAGTLVRLTSGGKATTVGSLSGTPAQIAVDAAGNVYAAGDGSGLLHEFVLGATGSYTESTITFAPVESTTGAAVTGAVAQAVTADASGNLYLYDSTSQAIYRQSVTPFGTQTVEVASGFSNVVALALDGWGNLYAADKGAGQVDKIADANIVTTVATSGSGWTVLAASLSPVALATDAGGDLYVADATSKKILEYSMGSVPSATTSASNTLALTLGAPTGVAVDALGNVYATDSTATSLQMLARSTTTLTFSTTSTPTTLTLGNVGNSASSGLAQSDATDFTVAAAGANGCAITTSSVYTPGELCSVTAEFTPQSSGAFSDAIDLAPTGSAGLLTLSGTLSGGTDVSTTTTIGSPNPSTPSFAPSGTEVSFTITVAATSGTPTGSVTYSVDGGTAVSANLANGTVTVDLSGLTAGSHSITATYPGSGNFLSSATVAPITFALQTIVPTISWTPSSMAQPVSAALGAGVLDAIVSPSVTGAFVYSTSGSPNCASTTTPTVDASTYLPVGSYTLYATFCPADSVDYTSVSMTASGSYTVTMATALPAVGASTNVVAADGTGNFTSLTTALAALPATGGTVYLKPGYYLGQNAISYPNVALRGLGGNPANVVLSGEGSTYNGQSSSSSALTITNPLTKATLPYSQFPSAAAFNSDPGSATLDVSNNGYMGLTSVTGSYSPAGFYAENLTIQNTFNTDSISTTTWQVVGGNCTGGQAASTLETLYNQGTECNSQALALYITADQAILNNVVMNSQQDTFAAFAASSGNIPARQYLWQSLITGDVDYVFGDGATVFDHSDFFTTYHGSSATGTETIQAQYKQNQNYLSGYICNACTLMSQSTGMSSLYFGRPWGPYSTWVMLNSQADQVNPAGYLAWSGTTNLSTSTYLEYNSTPYTDPSVGTAPYPSGVFLENSSLIADDPTSGYLITPTAGNTGEGVTDFSSRETTSTNPGSLGSEDAAGAVAPITGVQMTAAQAQPYFPVNFFSTAVPAENYPNFSNFSTTWNPVTALAAEVNAFAPSATSYTLSSQGAAITILGRPQTPGAGVIPTGTYSFYDNVGVNQACSAAGGGCTLLATGTLDASGEAYLMTGSSTTFGALPAGTNYISMVYSGDANFNGGASQVTTIIVPGTAGIGTTTALTVANPTLTYGGTISGTVTVTQQSGSGAPSGSVTFYAGATAVGTCALVNGSCNYTLSSVGAGVQSLTASYAGNSTFARSTSVGASINVARAILDVTANNITVAVGAALPAYAATITGFLNGDTQATALSGAPALTSTATNSSTPGEYPISVTLGTLSAANYTFTFTSGYLQVVPSTEVAAVATGDARTVTEPSFPAICQQLTAAIAMVNNDIPASVDATNTNPDGSRIQTALNACAGTGQAVELSIPSTGTSAGDSAFLSGPLTMPSGVTLLVDPGVVLFFSRNVQDYNTTSGANTCGTINDSSATSSCKPLIDIPASSSNVGIMGFGKLDGRGGDPLLNGFASSGYTAPSSYTWWNLSSQANGEGTQQNPRFLQIEQGASGITLYKITLRNSPLFHISTTGAISDFTAWDVKIVTPTTARNTDGIDPGNVTNFTVTRSWISDGDDNVAVGASGSNPASNISITNNHLFAGHGQSIGSYTQAGVSNVLFDGNIAAGNGFTGSASAQHGSSVSTTGTFLGGARDGNSTGIRIKSSDDRGGVVQNIQYSNQCLLDHATDIDFTPLYNSNTGTQTPNFKNILLENIVFSNDDGSTGTVQFTGAVNPPSGTATTINPLQVTLSNATFPNALSASSFVNSGSEGTETNAQLTFGPGMVSTNFTSAWDSSFAGSNGNTVTNNITATSLQAPSCSYTYIAPELTGPAGLPQTITQGQNATAVVILTPAVGGAAYPTGTVTLTDALTGATYNQTLSGSSDTLFVTLSGLTPGTHTFTATYSGDTNYVVPQGATYYSITAPYVVTVNAGSLATTTTVLGLSSNAAVYGTAVTATATITGSSPSGSVQFTVSGGGLTGSSNYATATLTPTSSTTSTASTSITLPASATAYSIQAVYGGDSANATSTSTAAALTIGQASQTITFNNPGDQSLAGSLPLNATATSGLAVSFTSLTTSVCTVSATTASLLGAGTCTIQATQAGNTDFAAATPVSQSFTVNAAAATATLSTLSPGFAAQGGAAFTLTINGSGFVTGSTIDWGATPLTTTYISSTELTAQVPASDLATAGITTISVATSTGTASNMLQFAVDSGSSNSLPTATTTTASTSPGETVTYIVSLPAGATFDSVQCLNLPSGSTCSYSGDTLTVTTSSSTPGGAFLFTAVFTETISEASAGLIVLPILLLPLWLFRKNWSTRRLWRSAVLLIAVAASFTALGCGSSNNSNSTPTSQTVTSSVSLTLKVQ